MSDSSTAATMLRERRRGNLQRLLLPRHVAVVGGLFVEDAVRVCRQSGFQGSIWPVTRRARELGGEPCFDSIGALPEAPDAALVMASREPTIEIVRALAQRGAGGAVCYASGYAESGPEGQRMQKILVEAAGDLAAVGPNCNGLANFLDRLILWPNPELPAPAVAKGVAILSQSGAFLVNVCNSERSLPIAIAVSIGNQAVLDIADYVAVLIEDERIAAIGAYLESIPDPPALSRAALAAAQKRVPLVVMKTGRTTAGATRAATHTGALIGSDDVASAFFDRFAIIRVHGPSAFIETLKNLSVNRPPAGRKLAAIALSGGIATMVADSATVVGLDLPCPAPDDAALLADRIPKNLPVGNPLDCSPPLKAETGIAMTNQAALESCFLTMAAGDYDMAALFIDFPRAEVDQRYLWEPSAMAMAATAKAIDKPCAVVSMLPEALPEYVRQRLAAAAVAPLQGLDDALQALAAAAWYSQRRRALLRGEECGPCALPSLPTLECEPRLLDEVASKALLRSAGLPIVAGRVVSAVDVEAAAEAIGYPVVVKIVSDKLPHKAKSGGVALNLNSASAVRDAVTRITNAVTNSPGIAAEHFLVESMIVGSVAELIVGVKRDEAFGLVLLIGAGGVGVEALDDHAMLLLPATVDDVEGVLTNLKLGRRLVQLGTPIDGVVSAIAKIAHFAMDQIERLVALDVNPILVMPKGDVVVVDALLSAAYGAR